MCVCNEDAYEEAAAKADLQIKTLILFMYIGVNKGASVCLSASERGVDAHGGGPPAKAAPQLVQAPLRQTPGRTLRMNVPAQHSPHHYMTCRAGSSTMRQRTSCTRVLDTRQDSVDERA